MLGSSALDRRRHVTVVRHDERATPGPRWPRQAGDRDRRAIRAGPAAVWSPRQSPRSDDAGPETLRNAGAPIDAADNSGTCPASSWPQRGYARRRANRDSISVPLVSGRRHDADGSAYVGVHPPGGNRCNYVVSMLVLSSIMVFFGAVVPARKSGPNPSHHRTGRFSGWGECGRRRISGTKSSDLLERLS